MNQYPKIAKTIIQRYIPSTLVKNYSQFITKLKQTKFESIDNELNKK